MEGELNAWLQKGRSLSGLNNGGGGGGGIYKVTMRSINHI